MPRPDPPKDKAHGRAAAFDVATASCQAHIMAALTSGERMYGRLAAHDAADALAAWNTRDGWPFFVRTIQALEAAGVLS